MDDQNELNDIVLNKPGGAKPAKKIILVIAVLVIILIIVISLFNTFSSSTKHHIQAMNQQTKLPTPPQPLETNSSQNQLFQPAKVITENNTTAQTTTAALNKIAQKLKQESMQTADTMPNDINTVQTNANNTQQTINTMHLAAKHISKETRKHVKAKRHYSIKKLFSPHHNYIQVGAFVRFHPNKKFLASIKKHDYTYKYKKVKINGKMFTKVLIGPFSSKSQTKKALTNIRKEINSHAYIIEVR